MSPALLDGLGLAASWAFVFAFIGGATLLMRRRLMRPAVTRKVIHIGVSHWWLIAMAMMDDPWVASVGPASFIVINTLALRHRFFPAMDQGTNRHNWGTVYFPVALIILVNLCWRGVMPIWVGGIAVLVLGWGDGLAALIGEENGSPGVHIWGGRKSAAGTIMMFCASFAVTLVFTLIFNPRYGAFVPAVGVSALIAAAATVVELFTPLGIDNLTVPLAVAVLYTAAFL